MWFEWGGLLRLDEGSEDIRCARFAQIRYHHRSASAGWSASPHSSGPRKLRIKGSRACAGIADYAGVLIAVVGSQVSGVALDHSCFLARCVGPCCP